MKPSVSCQPGPPEIRDSLQNLYHCGMLKLLKGEKPYQNDISGRNLMEFSTPVTIYLLLINLLAFALMGIDKEKARRHKWRIPEKTLFLSALLGGSVGAIAGMQLFRHKTKHWYFVMGMPAIRVLQATGYFFLSHRF